MWACRVILREREREREGECLHGCVCGWVGVVIDLNACVCVVIDVNVCGRVVSDLVCVGVS